MPAKKSKNKKKQPCEKESFLSRLSRIFLCPSTYVVIVTIPVALCSICTYCKFQDFSKKDTRAYLSVVNPVLDTLHTYGDLRITYTIQNTGKTPAYEVTNIIYFEEQWKSIGPTIPDTTNPGKCIIAPGKIEYIKRFTQVDSLKHSTMEGDVKRRFFFGRIEYVDIFEQNHWLTFAFEYVWRNTEYGKFDPYPEYNDTDKN